MSYLSQYTNEELRNELKAREFLNDIELYSKSIIEYFNN